MSAGVVIVASGVIVAGVASTARAMAGTGRADRPAPRAAANGWGPLAVGRGVIDRAAMATAASSWATIGWSGPPTAIRAARPRLVAGISTAREATSTAQASQT